MYQFCQNLMIYVAEKLECINPCVCFLFGLGIIAKTHNSYRIAFTMFDNQGESPS